MGFVLSRRSFGGGAEIRERTSQTASGRAGELAMRLLVEKLLSAVLAVKRCVNPSCHLSA